MSYEEFYKDLVEKKVKELKKVCRSINENITNEERAKLRNFTSHNLLPHLAWLSKNKECFSILKKQDLFYWLVFLRYKSEYANKETDVSTDLLLEAKAHLRNDDDYKKLLHLKKQSRLTYRFMAEKLEVTA